MLLLHKQVRFHGSLSCMTINKSAYLKYLFFNLLMVNTFKSTYYFEITLVICSVFYGMYV